MKVDLRLIAYLLVALALFARCQPSDTPDLTSQEVSSEPTKSSQGVKSLTPQPGSDPEITPTSTPEADPREELGKPTWRATFGPETDQTWGTFDDQQASAEVIPGQLVMTAKKDNSFDTWSLSYPTLSDFYLEVVGTSGPGCVGKDRFGPIVRAPENNVGYLYQISCDGMFQVRKWDGEQYTDIIKWTPSEYIVPGPNQTHRIGYMAEGNQMAVYVNGFLLGEFEDDSYVEGKFGVSVAASDTPGFTVTITDAEYWELPQ